jgi:EAL domain-containing protein (putative c-di-GMP-specific phosphodiesterase class I)
MSIESISVEQHKNKLTFLLKVASIVVALTATMWAIFFVTIQDWLAAFTEFILIVLGCLGYTQTKHNNTKIIAYVYLPILFVVMCFICVFYDTPNAIVSRSNNHYFLPMALYAYVLYQDENPYLKITVPVVISLAFLLFACTNFGIDLSTMTNDQRLVRVWVTNSVALIMLALVALIMQSDFKVRHTLELELSNALLKGELKLYYQPQVEQGGSTIGAEALTRWRHSSLGIIAPEVFIPLAEKSDLILHIGKHVLSAACNQLASWAQNEATAHLTLSVNISVKQFQHHDFVPQIVSLIEETKIDARRLQLEITESIFAHDLEDIMAKMTQLKAYGVRLSLDDFGTGYSSLAYVKNLPLDELKIDKSFIKDVLTSVSAATITKMIISLAHELNIAIIAEGVETNEQRQFLIDNGCHNFQGYLYSTPLPINEFNTFVLNKGKI